MAVTADDQMTDRKIKPTLGADRIEFTIPVCDIGTRSSSQPGHFGYFCSSKMLLASMSLMSAGRTSFTTRSCSAIRSLDAFLTLLASFSSATTQKMRCQTLYVTTYRYFINAILLRVVTRRNDSYCGQLPAQLSEQRCRRRSFTFDGYAGDHRAARQYDSLFT